MYTIENSIEITAPVATLRTAISTRDGFRAWLAADTELDTAGRFTFPFGPRAVTLTLDRADDCGIVMTCVQVQDNPEWLGTELAITLTPLAGGKTRLDLAHAGYPSKDECYERSTMGWAHFLLSLAQYVTTGKGNPFDSKVTAAAPTSAAVAS
ncbi:MAG: SRPBCC domain-containing protein [Polyangiaceae bacterium]